MASDCIAFCPVVNRRDLLEAVLAACLKSGVVVNVIDNSEEGLWDHERLPVPLSFSQSMNLEFVTALKQEKRFILHMHSDAIIPDGVIQKLLETARTIDAHNPKWAVIYTHYDVLAVYNPKCYQAIGGFDTTLPAYFSDNDWYHRCDLAGWERINTGIEVGHIGSQTINSDPYLKAHNGVTFPLYRQYYVAKWGGEPGQERYKVPFNDFKPNRISIGTVNA